MRQRKIVLFELNEVPFKVIDQFCKWRPRSTLARKLPGCFQYQSITQDVGSLSPWMTWPSLHRGVNDERHTIRDFGQDLTEISQQFPPVWDLLRRSGVSVGICGTLHSYPMPQDLQNYAFYLPDTFAAGSECFPQSLSLFQEFNLDMARKSARNVDKRVPWRSAMSVLARAPELGFKLQTFAGIGGQLLSEKTRKGRTTRRRTYQSVLAFDIFMRQLEKTKPAFSSFFTNHVASSMHRFWAASFPHDYEEFGYDQEWVRTYRDEIDWTMGKADEFFARLVKFADNNPGYVIWVATSMGQAATLTQPLETQLYITDFDRFMATLGFEQSEWSRRPAMLPQWNVYMTAGNEGRLHEALSTLFVDGRPVSFRQRENGFFSIDMGQKNLSKESVANFNGRTIALADLGLVNVDLDEKSGANAYHVPQGCLIIYDPEEQSPKDSRPEISTLDIAPAILRNYAKTAPRYMSRPANLAGN